MEPHKKTEYLNARIYPETRELLEAAAKATGRSIGEIVEQALQNSVPDLVEMIASIREEEETKFRAKYGHKPKCGRGSKSAGGRNKRQQTVNALQPVA